MPQLLTAIAIGYLLGSIPFAYLVARAWGVDVFTVGTRNPGAANVFRQVGAVPGSIVFLLDIGKGAAAVVLARLLVTVAPAGSDDGSWLARPEALILPGLAAVVGHWFPVFLRFRGGAGLAAAIGASLALLPLAGLAAIGVGLLFQWRFRSSGYSALVGLLVYVGVGVGLGEWSVALAGCGTFAAVFGYYVVVSFRKKRGA